MSAVQDQLMPAPGMDAWECRGRLFRVLRDTEFARDVVERESILRVGIVALIKDIEAARHRGTDGRAVRTWKGMRRP